ALLVRRAGSGAGHGPRRPGAETAAALAAGLTLGAAAMHPAALHPAGTPATGAGVKGPGTGAPYLFLPAALWATYAYGAAGAVELGLWALLALGLVLGAHLGGLLRRHRGAALGGGAFGAALPAFALALLLRQFQLTAAAGYLVLLTVLGLMLATGWLLAGTLSSGTAEAPKVEENKRIL
ncbi:MAG: hypothetical protein H5T97_13340, partial [Firmicutes bacterium]|nr:hypothetical protein [Bacillota bacterium]